jgi:hypothetical protein
MLDFELNFLQNVIFTNIDKNDFVEALRDIKCILYNIIGKHSFRDNFV